MDRNSEMQKKKTDVKAKIMYPIKLKIHLNFLKIKVGKN